MAKYKSVLSNFERDANGESDDPIGDCLFVDHQYNWMEFVTTNTTLYDVHGHPKNYYFVFKKNKDGKAAMWYKKRICSPADSYCPRDEQGFRFYDVSNI